MWIHESFTTYSENLFLDYHYGKEASSDYVIGTRFSISNKSPMIGPYGVNRRGSDIYTKGANVLHTLRQIANDDEKWRMILRGLNKKFYHQTVESKQIEDYISLNIGFDLSTFKLLHFLIVSFQRNFFILQTWFCSVGLRGTC